MARVLVIDGSAEDRDVCASALAEEHEVQTAFDTRTGLFLLTAESWDVVILDPTLRDEGQISIARYVQELPQRPELIVVALPADVEHVMDTFRAGAFELLTKPIVDAALQKAVANAAQMRSLRLERRKFDERNRRQRRELEVLVQERTQQLEQIFANVPGMLYRVVVHPDGLRLFSFVSASCRELLGVAPERLNEDAEVFDSLVHPDDAARFEHTRSLAEQTRTHLRFEGRFLLPTGRVRWLQCVANPTALTEGCVAWDGILMDITERVELQSQLLLADRLATVGTMAASVAHEVNNPLFYISANLEALSDQVGNLGVGQLQPLLREAADGVSRIENAMRDLRTFVRSPEEVVRPVSVSKVLDASVRLASNEIRHRAQMEREYQGDAMVRADESSLGQLFLNLLIIAAQSIPEGNAHANKLVLAMWVQGPEVHIEITDTSPGLPVEDLERAFDPLAAASDRLRAGTSLYVCHRIVSFLGGQISATSSPDSGNYFHVRLPVCAKPSDDVRKPTLRLVQDRPVRVLVIDDEELVLKAFMRTLEGHEVQCARSGREAIEILRSEPPFDIVLCDVMMPDMNGQDVYNAAKEVRPGTQERIVFVTGGAFTKDANNFLNSVANKYIEKPFTKASIRELIADLRL